MEERDVYTDRSAEMMAPGRSIEIPKRLKRNSGYEYDFGDRWEHVLTLEKFLAREVVAPRCMAGNRACPPEDCGGPWVYDEFVRSRRSRKGRVSRKWQHRMGHYWDADTFDLEATNKTLKSEWQRILQH